MDYSSAVDGGSFAAWSEGCIRGLLSLGIIARGKGITIALEDLGSWEGWRWDGVSAVVDKIRRRRGRKKGVRVFQIIKTSFYYR
jgi:hypothetical protein